MKDCFIFLAALLVSQFVLAQYVTYEFEQNNYSWKQDTYGNLFFDQASDAPGFNIPISEANHAIRNSTLWVGGMTPSNELYLAGHTLCDDGCAYAPGPLTTDGSAVISPPIVSQYNKIWFIHRSDVDTHMAYYECLMDSDCNINENFPDGYQIPESISHWPAHGQPALGQDYYLASFQDLPGNGGTEGIYEPEIGDYPHFCGDFAAFQVSNDYAAESSISDPIGLEIQTLVFGYWSSTKNLENTLFVKHKIINRGVKTLNNTYFGVWTDFSLGNKNDDYVGTDVQRSMVYAYNGDNFDDSSALGPGYGNDLPAVGLRILGGPLLDEDGLDNEPISEDFSTYGIQATGWGDGIEDNERMGLAYSMSPATSGEDLFATGLPQVAQHYYNYLTGKWKNGDYQRYVNNGYDPLEVTPSTRYVYPGLSDPLDSGTEGAETEYDGIDGWTEVAEGHAPGDRNMVVSSGPFTMGPGSIQEFEYAYIFVRDSFEPGVPVLETLQHFADEIVGIDCFYSDSLGTSTQSIETDKDPVRIFPNPANAYFIIECAQPNNGTFTLCDMTGRLVKTGQVSMGSNFITVSHLKSGVYVVSVNRGDNLTVQRIIIR